MSDFLGENFLLQTKGAVELYHAYAATMPIFDYHCHLPPADIAGNRKFSSVTEVWLGGDHYKWRAMRANGVPEELITGKGSDWEKFEAWAKTVPDTIGNPLYQWTHLELKRYFGIEETLLSESTAKEVFDRCNEVVASEEFRARRIMERMNVRVACTTDDPCDNLEHHEALARDPSFKVRIYPAFRPDKVFKVESPETTNPWIDRLQEASGIDIRSLDDLLSALRARVDFFHERGCRLSDHGIQAPFAADFTGKEASQAFASLRSGKAPTAEAGEKLNAAVMLELGRMYAKRGWTMQLHLGALRNNRSRLFGLLGPDTGFDCIGDFEIAGPLVKFLDRLDATGELPRTILYSLNARDNDVLSSVAGSFQDAAVPGKIQHGSAWWFHDQRDGMERQMSSLANIGLLRRFVGMITDSRSFLSYPRHEYFRRVLCNLLGRWIDSGEIPADMELLGAMVQDISYNNAERYFAFPAVTRQ